MACSPVPKVGGAAAPSAPPVPTPMVGLCKNKHVETQFRTKYFIMSISTTLFASLFITGQLRNPWQMLAEPWGSRNPG